jgi:hypothetical protein
MLVADNLLNGYLRAHLVDPSDGAFHNVVLVFKPREEAGEYSAYIVNGYLARSILRLEICEVAAYVVGRHVVQFFQ